MTFSLWTLSICAVVLASASQLSLAENKILMKQLAKVDRSIDKLNQEFEQVMQKFFFQPQQDANEMIKLGGSDAEKGYAIKKMSQVFSESETVIHGITLAALLKAREIMQDEGNDDQINEVGANILMDVLERRALLRAALDGLYHSNEFWKKLHLLIEHYGNIEDLEDKVSAFALQIYQTRADLIEAMQMTYMEQQMLLDQYFTKTGIEDEDEYSVLEDMDSLIDSKFDSPQCVSMKPDEDYYNTRCLFDSQPKIEATVQHLISSELLSQIRKIDHEVKDHVKEWTQQEVDQLDEIEDVMDLFDRYLANARKQDVDFD